MVQMRRGEGAARADTQSSEGCSPQPSQGHRRVSGTIGPFHGKNSRRMETTRAPAGPRLLRVAAPLGQVRYPALRWPSSERHVVLGNWDSHPDGLPWQTGTGSSVRGPQLRPPPPSTLPENEWAPLLGSLSAKCTALIPPKPLGWPAGACHA